MVRKKIIICLVIFITILIFSWGNFSWAANLANRLKGKILLQVEQNGEAWYINPTDEKRYYMGRPADAFDLMRNFGIGITTENLKKIPVAEANFGGTDTDGDGLSDMIEDAFGTDAKKIDTDGDGHKDKSEILNSYNPLVKWGKYPIDTNFTSKYLGRIFLQVEDHGEAWYIYPGDSRRYFLGRPADAFEIMRGLGLGITDANLGQISIGGDLMPPEETPPEETPPEETPPPNIVTAYYCQMVACNSKLTGRSEYPGPTSAGKLKWSYKLPSERVINMQPTIAKDGTIYVGTWGYMDLATVDRSRGKLYAFTADGSLKWIYDAGGLESHYVGTIETSPIIADDGTIYFGRGDGILYALNNDGTLKWKYETLANKNGRGQIFSSPILGSDGTIYFGTQAYVYWLGFGYNIFYALEDKGSYAQLKWRYPENSSFNSWIFSHGSVADDGTVYFSSGNKVYAVNSSGQFQWDYTTTYQTGNIVIGLDGLYVQTYTSTGSNSSIVALNSDGTRKWEYEVPFMVSRVPRPVDNIIYFSTGNSQDSAKGDEDGRVYALEDCGQNCVNKKWEYTLSNSAGTSEMMIDSQGIIFVAGHGNQEASPAIIPKVYALEDKGSYASELWNYQMPEGEIWGAGPVIGANKTIVFGNSRCNEDSSGCDQNVDFPSVYVLGE